MIVRELLDTAGLASLERTRLCQRGYYYSSSEKAYIEFTLWHCKQAGARGTHGVGMHNVVGLSTSF